jgi:hypothetical protein
MSNGSSPSIGTPPPDGLMKILSTTHAVTFPLRRRN